MTIMKERQITGGLLVQEAGVLDLRRGGSITIKDFHLREMYEIHWEPQGCKKKKEKKVRRMCLRELSKLTCQ